MKDVWYRHLNTGYHFTQPCRLLIMHASLVVVVVEYMMWVPKKKNTWCGSGTCQLIIWRSRGWSCRWTTVCWCSHHSKTSRIEFLHPGQTQVWGVDAGGGVRMRPWERPGVGRGAGLATGHILAQVWLHGRLILIRIRWKGNNTAINVMGDHSGRPRSM
jgi:hypothetical protein